MKFLNKLFIFTSILLLVYGVYWSMRLRKINITNNNDTSAVKTEDTPNDSSASDSDAAHESRITVIAEGLDTPWAAVFLPDGSLLVTERKGTIRLMKHGVLVSRPVATLTSVKEIGEGGLQGITIHPDFGSNKYVYVYYTYSGGESGTLNRVSRFTFDGNGLSNETIIIDAIPGAQNHDGGRIKFGPDKKLYITTGDAQDPSHAQDINSLAGKILRVNDDGSPVPGNPYNNRTYSYGHRNPQGITWDSQGQLWATEHGPSGVQTGNDEFNRIESGKNYGWPDIKGMQTKAGMVTPVIESGFLNTWAPAGLAYLPAQAGIEGKFYFAGLRGSALYELDSNGANLNTYLKNEFGRLREVIIGPDNMLYVTTSNQDGRGNPKVEDDKILRINPNKL